MSQSPEAAAETDVQVDSPTTEDGPEVTALPDAVDDFGRVERGPRRGTWPANDYY